MNANLKEIAHQAIDAAASGRQDFGQLVGMLMKAAIREAQVVQDILSPF